MRNLTDFGSGKRVGDWQGPLKERYACEGKRRYIDSIGNLNSLGYLKLKQKGAYLYMAEMQLLNRLGHVSQPFSSTP